MTSVLARHSSCRDLAVNEVMLGPGRDLRELFAPPMERRLDLASRVRRIPLGVEHHDLIQSPIEEHQPEVGRVLRCQGFPLTSSQGMVVATIDKYVAALPESGERLMLDGLSDFLFDVGNDGAVEVVHSSRLCADFVPDET